MPMTLIIPAQPAAWDEEKEEFIETKGATLVLEHSLVSVAKWESKYKKPFISDKPKTRDETLDYIKFMTITQNVDPKVYSFITNKMLNDINEYICDPMSATIVPQKNNRHKGRPQIITNALVYSWMVAQQIPFSCEKWHFNRLLKLIEVCNFNNSSGDKVSKASKAREYAALNEARLKRYNSRG